MRSHRDGWEREGVLAYLEQGLQSHNIVILGDITVRAGLKPPTPLGFGLHIVMAKLKRHDIQDSTGD